MELKIPNIVQVIKLKDYAPEFGEVQIFVWVNPTRALMIQKDERLMKKTASREEIGAWFAEIWSQGAEGTHWTADEVLKMVDTVMEKDPGLWGWLCSETARLIGEHRRIKKKPLSMQPSS
jgi:formyltetrahydrofolate synthetase